MKLIIQIPCFNEEDNIFDVLNNIPKKIKGVDEIKIIVLNDGSSDKTVEIAKNFDVEIVNLNHAGLSCVFKEGVNKALENGCDILVNLDGDNQYDSNDIEKLILPILNNKADITIGTRPIDKIKNFSPFKKLFQKFGSFIVNLITKTNVKDAASGFRAFNRKSLLKLNIFNNFTYTIESIIQAKHKNLIIENVDIKINHQKNRKSRLFKNNLDYILKQGITLLRFFIIYSPTKFFGTISLLLFLVGFTLGLRFIYYFINSQGTGHIQSLILCAIILTLSFILINITILSDVISVNRRLLEDIQEDIRKKKYKK